MDNNHLVVVGEGKETFSLAMQIAFAGGQIITSAIGYTINDEFGLSLYKYKSDFMTLLPIGIDVEPAIDLAWAWLQKQHYPKQPVHHSDCYKGWKIFNNEWGYTENNAAAFISIKPKWVTHGE